MQGDTCRQVANQLVPDADNQIFCRTHFTFQKIHFHIQILMIQFFYNLFLNNIYSVSSHPSKTLYPGSGYSFNGHI